MCGRRGIEIHDVVGNTETDGRDRAWFRGGSDGGTRRQNPIHLLDLLESVERHRARAEPAVALVVGDLDAAAVVRDAAAEQNVEMLRQRPHRRQREDAHDDAADSESRAQLATPEVSQNLHRFALQVVCPCESSDFDDGIAASPQATGVGRRRPGRRSQGVLARQRADPPPGKHHDQRTARPTRHRRAQSRRGDRHHHDRSQDRDPTPHRDRLPQRRWPAIRQRHAGVQAELHREPAGQPALHLSPQGCAERQLRRHGARDRRLDRASRGAAFHRTSVEARRPRNHGRTEPALRSDHRRPRRLTMAKLIYTTIASLDGYVADADGKFGWAEPDEEVFRFVNELERPIGIYLFGRRMYEVMVYWETAHTAAGLPPVEREFAAIWRAASKIVYSRTLTQASSARTTIEREFDPASVRRLKAEARCAITGGGPHLGAEAI